MSRIPRTRTIEFPKWLKDGLCTEVIPELRLFSSTDVLIRPLDFLPVILSHMYNKVSILKQSLCIQVRLIRSVSKA